MSAFEPPEAAVDKRLPLAEAVRRHVRAGDTLYFAVTHARAHAAMYELCRQFRGRDPGFTLATLGVSGAFVLPVHLGLCRRVVTTFAGDGVG